MFKLNKYHVFLYLPHGFVAVSYILLFYTTIPRSMMRKPEAVADPGGGGVLRQKILFFPIAEGGAKIFKVFRVKNHDLTTKNHIFSNFRGEDRWATIKKHQECNAFLGGWPKSIPTSRSAWNKRLNPTLGCLN
jgi:hypothetical protein